MIGIVQHCFLWSVISPWSTINSAPNWSTLDSLTKSCGKHWTVSQYEVQSHVQRTSTHSYTSIFCAPASTQYSSLLMGSKVRASTFCRSFLTTTSWPVLPFRHSRCSRERGGKPWWDYCAAAWYRAGTVTFISHAEKEASLESLCSHQWAQDTKQTTLTRGKEGWNLLTDLDGVQWDVSPVQAVPVIVKVQSHGLPEASQRQGLICACGQVIAMDGVPHSVQDELVTLWKSTGRETQTNHMIQFVLT